jgi:hypothetical protein
MTQLQGWILIGLVLYVGVRLSIFTSLLFVELGDIRKALNEIRDEAVRTGGSLSEMSNSLHCIQTDTHAIRVKSSEDPAARFLRGDVAGRDSTRTAPTASPTRARNSYPASACHSGLSRFEAEKVRLKK